ncbi:MAG TPA: 3-phosphoshikimate 1-carboxyvinyltransferase [Vicinamibacterales bacterium]
MSASPSKTENPRAAPKSVPRVAHVNGSLRVPGDKSISHRYAMLAAIADGVSRLEGYAPGADCAATLDCLERLGTRISRGERMTIEGRGVRGLRAPSEPLDAANSGTSMRLLAGLAAAHPFATVIGGDASLSRRPMRRVIEPLTQMGASIESIDGRPPLTIRGGDLRGLTYEPEVPSAQVKSAVLLAGLQASGHTTVLEPSPTRDHTERAFRAFGVRVAVEDRAVTVAGGQRLHAIDARIPGDFSSAVFWLVLASGTPAADLTIEDVGVNPSRTGVMDVLRRAGAHIDVDAQIDVDVPQSAGGSGEPMGRLRVRFDQPRSFEVAPAEVPAMIDEIPALAALAAMQPGVSMTVRGASELRVKESDRIARLAEGFRALGASVAEYADGFTINGGPLRGGFADAAGDHRLAMAFAIAGSRAAGPVEIGGAEAVAVSYPGFFDELERIARS